MENEITEDEKLLAVDYAIICETYDAGWSEDEPANDGAEYYATHFKND